ncbi:MAG: hypothetical protein U0939_20880 [Pirellulales bacterium]
MIVTMFAMLLSIAPNAQSTTPAFVPVGQAPAVSRVERADQPAAMDDLSIHEMPQIETKSIQAAPASLKRTMRKQEEVDQRPVRVYAVYYGRYGTYHLTPKVGTAHRIHCSDNTLTALMPNRTGVNHYLYKSLERGHEQDVWAFEIHPTGCHFAIWLKSDFRRNGTLEWRLIDFADRVNPIPHP